MCVSAGWREFSVQFRADRPFDVSVAITKPMTDDHVEALMRDSCDSKWRTANISGGFGSSRMAEVSCNKGHDVVASDVAVLMLASCGVHTT